MPSCRARIISIAAGVSLLALPLEAGAGVFREARIEKFVKGTRVDINLKPARVGEFARSGNSLGTGTDTEIRLLFDGETIGHLLRDSRIKLGTRCFEVDEGTVLLSSGKQGACVGNTFIGRRSTIVLTRNGPDRFTLSVLSGAAYVGTAPPPGDVAAQAQPVERLYPRFLPVFGLGGGGFTSNSGGVAFGDSTALLLGEANVYLPLLQRRTSQVLYSYTSVSANFDEFWGVSSEVGYRWFDPRRKSSQGFFVGYDGVQSTGCFLSQVAVGAEVEVSRWQFGVNGGIRTDDCEDGVSYASAQVGIPVGRIGDDTAHLYLGPYLVTGQGEDYAGGRVTLNVPVNPHLTLSAYGQYDGLFDTVIGGNVSYRFGAGRRFLHDPNRSTSKTIKPSTEGASQPQQEAVASAGSVTVVPAGEEVTLDGQGQLLDRSRMIRPRFQQLVKTTMGGFDLLPESLSINDTYKDLYGESTEEVMAITGARWVINARTPYPRLRGAQTPFVPKNPLGGDEVVEEEVVKEEVGEEEDGPLREEAELPDKILNLGSDSTP